MCGLSSLCQNQVLNIFTIKSSCNIILRNCFKVSQTFLQLIVQDYLSRCHKVLIQSVWSANAQKITDCSTKWIDLRKYFYLWNPYILRNPGKNATHYGTQNVILNTCATVNTIWYFQRRVYYHWASLESAVKAVTPYHCWVDLAVRSANRTPATHAWCITRAATQTSVTPAPPVTSPKVTSVLSAPTRLCTSTCTTICEKQL